MALNEEEQNISDCIFERITFSVGIIEKNVAAPTEQLVYYYSCLLHTSMDNGIFKFNDAFLIREINASLYEMTTNSLKGDF